MARGRDEHEARKNAVSLLGKDLIRRAKSKCELCGENTSLTIYEVPPVADPEVEKSLMLCSTCLEQVENPKTIDTNHWYCLNDSAWSETPAVQVMSWRRLNRLKDQTWAEDLLEQRYLDEDIQEWAEQG